MARSVAYRARRKRARDARKSRARMKRIREFGSKALAAWRLTAVGGDGERVAEASDFGWRPGEWATRVTVDGSVFEFVDFDRNSDSEVLSARYRTASGRTLTVFND